MAPAAEPQIFRINHTGGALFVLAALAAEFSIQPLVMDGSVLPTSSEGRSWAHGYYDPGAYNVFIPAGSDPLSFAYYSLPSTNLSGPPSVGEPAGEYGIYAPEGSYVEWTLANGVPYVAVQVGAAADVEWTFNGTNMGLSGLFSVNTFTGPGPLQARNTPGTYPRAVVVQDFTQSPGY